MKKIIWGIAAVFCMQIAFQLAMLAERSNGDYATLRTPLQNGIDSPSPIIDADDLDMNVATIVPAAESLQPPMRTKVLIRYIKAPTYRSIEPQHVTTAAFKPVVITYDRSGALTDTSNTATAQRMIIRTERPDDRRSLMAKVVTKPYDWLKLVGSKLR
jgi:hypothetical protein